MNKKIFRMGLRLSIVPLILLISMTTVVTFAQAEEYLAPVITSISPDSGEQGQGLDLTISGYNFMEGVEVTFHPPEGIIVESVDFTDAQSVTTFIVIDIDALAGPRDVTVISPDGQGYTLDQGFTVTEAKPIIDVTPPPMITGLTATDIGITHTSSEFDGGYMSGLAWAPECEEEVEVYVDIKPTSCPNPLNLKSKGVLPMAILGTEDFDVTQIDPASVALYWVGSDPFDPIIPPDEISTPLRTALEDVATPFEGELVDCLSCTEEGPDGYDDLTLKFSTQAIVEVIEDEVEDGDCISLILAGKLLDGTAFSGSDIVKIIKKGR